MSTPLSPKTMALVKRTAPALQQHGVAISTRMYERLFVDPEIKMLFDMAAQESGAQPKRLAAAILAFAQNIDRLDVLKTALERISRRHIETHIKAAHYPAVADALLPAIRDVLGDGATDEILAAWGEAYWFLADILIARETQLYRETQDPIERAIPLPNGLESYKCTPSFSEETVPNALRNDHATKAGTWALIRVRSGSLKYCVADARRRRSETILTPDNPPGVVEPTIVHHVTTMGPVRFHVEFLREARLPAVLESETPLAPAQL